MQIQSYNEVGIEGIGLVITPETYWEEAYLAAFDNGENFEQATPFDKFYSLYISK